MSTKDFNLFAQARACLVCRDPERKLALAHALEADWRRGALTRDAVELELVETAGHPQRPELVHPRHLRPRSLGSEEGRLAMIHTITHIEFNAINLACDALFRFHDMPDAYYGDWIQVAREEAEHFALLRARLREAGRDYGDYPAHTGLWDMARKTAHDPLVRMALIPRMMEARGLDVTPGIMRRFAAVGDRRTVAALEVILREEVGHVEMGSRWFHHLCRERGLEPDATYFALLQQYLDGTIRCPLNREARRAARPGSAKGSWSGCRRCAVADHAPRFPRARTPPIMDRDDHRRGLPGGVATGSLRLGRTDHG